MLTKISVLIPTRHRVNRLRIVLDSYAATTEGGLTAELVFRVDDDDRETQDFLLQHSGLHVVIGPRYQGYGSMARFFNELYLESHGDVLMCGNDDMIFRTPHWATEILQAANAYPDGVFDLGVATFNESHYPFSIVSRRVANHLGFLWDPRIFWGDVYLRDVMNAFGRCIMLPHVRVDHDWMGFHPDPLFIESDKDVLRQNPTYWETTHKSAVDDAVSQLHNLIAAPTPA